MCVCVCVCEREREREWAHVGVDGAEEVAENLKLAVPPPHLVTNLLPLVVCLSCSCYSLQYPLTS